MDGLDAGHVLGAERDEIRVLFGLSPSSHVVIMSSFSPLAGSVRYLRDDGEDVFVLVHAICGGMRVWSVEVDPSMVGFGVWIVGVELWILGVGLRIVGVGLKSHRKA